MSPSTPAKSGLERLVEMTKNELAKRLSVSEHEIKLIEAKPVAWPDTSLGCPQEGIIYAQVLTPGFLVLLEHAGITFEYHTDKSRTIITCEYPSAPVSGTHSDS